MFEEYLIEVLEKSVEKNGDIPLTTGHLLNILKLTNRKMQHDDSLPDSPF